MNYKIDCPEISFSDDSLYLMNDVKIDFNQAKKQQNITAVYNNKEKQLEFKVIDGKIVDEVVWSETGGGYSKIFLRPLYQDEAVTRKYRGVPDIAGNADPKTGYIIYFNGKLKVIGGTNTVSPLYSGLTALLSQARGSIGYLNDIIYPNAKTVCYDIVEGSNGPDGKWDATVGWDPCSGNGRIYGDKLLETP